MTKRTNKKQRPIQTLLNAIKKDQYNKKQTIQPNKTNMTKKRNEAKKD